jgi:hypothetical protein
MIYNVYARPVSISWGQTPWNSGSGKTTLPASTNRFVLYPYAPAVCYTDQLPPLYWFYISKGTVSRERSIILIHIHSPRPLSFFFIAFLLRGKNLPGVPSRDLNSGLPYTAGQRTTNWATLHPYCATLHPTEPRCTLLSHAAPYWATLYPTEPRCTYWAPLHHYCSTLHPTRKIWYLDCVWLSKSGVKYLAPLLNWVTLSSSGERFVAL